MKYEYINSSTELTYKQFEEEIFPALLNIAHLQTIIVPSFFVRKIKLLTKDLNIQVSCLLDYPLGMSDSASRIVMSKEITGMADTVDISINANLLCNRKFSQIKKEISQHMECFPANPPRYVLEYRQFSPAFIKKACDILYESGVKKVCLSSGFFADNIDDYLIAAHLVQKHTKNLDVILYVNSISQKKINLLEKSSFGVIRTNSEHTLNQIQNYM